MAYIVEDRVLEASTGIGIGPMALSGAVTGYRRVSAVCAISDTLPYYIEAVDDNGRPTGDYEYGVATYSSANTITRTTVRGSSNGGLAVPFAAGTKLIGLGISAPSNPGARADWMSALGLSAPSGSSGVGFLQAGPGATGISVQNALRLMGAFPEQFGAVGDGVTDDTAALQACAQAHRVMVLSPGKRYLHTGLTFAQFGQTITTVAGGEYAGSALVYAGSGTAIKLEASVNYARIADGVKLEGVPAVGTDYYNTGSVGIDATAGNVSLEMENAWITSFETLVKSNFNSFYNEFIGCRFERFRYGLYNFSNNNLRVERNRFSRFNTAIQANGTNGPITINANSYEIFNGPIYNGTGAERGLVVFTGNYVETYDSMDLPTNFPASAGPNTTKFGGNTLFTGPIGVFISRDNELQIGGCFRVLSSTTAVDHLESTGNNVHIYTTGNNLDRMFSAASVIHLHVRDRLGVVQGADGGYSRAYNQPVIAQSDSRGRYDWYDCITSLVIFSTAKRGPQALLNGWTAPSADHGVPTAFLRDDGSVLLRGLIDGTAKTGDVAFTLPASLRPAAVNTLSVYANLVAASDYGAGNLVRFRYFYATGNLQLEGTPVSVANITLDGLVIAPRT